MKKILGLDLGTNSIGWSLIRADFEKKEGEILGLGSRIIPMSQDVLGKFDSGQSISQTAERTGYRGHRRLYQKDNLRRERLHRVLDIMGFLPEHYAKSIDFDERLGQFKPGAEVKLNYQKDNDGKHKFIFMNSFYEMVADFESKGQSSKIPYDWTLYYLRKKALKQRVSKEELSWIMLNFNQKRGYYQLRGEDEEDSSKLKEFHVLKVKEVINSGEQVKGNTLYDVRFENDWMYDRQITKTENWIGKAKEFIVTTSLDKQGNPQTDKEGNIKRSFKAVDSEQDWIAIKKKTEQDIGLSGKHVGEYIYETLLTNPSQKIRGKLVKTIERKFYKHELKAILNEQVKHHPELQDGELLQACINELYPRNEAHRNNISDKGFAHLIMEDIIFYQRPLKSKKSTIANCPYESKSYRKKVKIDENGSAYEKVFTINEPLKAIPKSNPLFQEFRLWQFIHNLRVYQREMKEDGKVKLDVDITTQLLTSEEDWTDLFDFLNARKEVEQKNFIDYFIKKKRLAKQDKHNYRWNYVEDKRYPCNETRAQFITKLSKVEGMDAQAFLTPEMEQKLWHIIYSVKDKKQFETTICNLKLPEGSKKESFTKQFIKFPPYANDYGAYSAKAIKKLLPLMRVGKYWDATSISSDVLDRIDKLLTGEFDENIRTRVRKKAIHLGSLEDFRGLPVWLACYVVYDRHSESNNTQWKSPLDIDKFLQEFKQHSLRNPIVEQVVTETLRVVRDIWQYHGESAENYFNEIHIELGRQMKNPANKRKTITSKIAENENTNHRIKELLKELMNDPDVKGEVRPHSPSHQEILKLYEDGVTSNPDVSYQQLAVDDVSKIRRNSNPSKSDINRYKLWLGQGYLSPYTGETIPLSRLFTTDYQIEHVIPQSRYFDDSLTNKVICESEVNQFKVNQTAYEFIKNRKGQKVELTQGRTVTLFTVEEYEQHCRKYFKTNRTKLTKLLSEDIPESFIERQMNDSRYISKMIKGLLSNIVREDGEQDAISKHVVPVIGSITSTLKNDWGLNDKWNNIIAPRFKRMNKLTKSNDFGCWDSKINAFRLTVPDDLQKGFNKKRIDHRHHSLDALVIACTSKDHINYITSLNTKRDNHSLVSKLRVVESGHYKDKKTGEMIPFRKPKDFHKPWPSFPVDAQNALHTTIISIKQNLRVINKTNNKTWQWVEENGQWKKKQVRQTKGDNWAIRKPMHKETVSGEVNVRTTKSVSFANGLKDWKNLVDKKLKDIIKKQIAKGVNLKGVVKHFKANPYEVNGEPVKNVEVYTYTENATATRQELTEKFSRKQLNSVTDSGIRSILNRHLKKYVDIKADGKHVERFDLAFSTEGLEEMNKNIKELNNRKHHHPIYKVRIYEEGIKFPVGHRGNRNTKYVEAAKGTNLFFAIYWNEEKQKREYETIPLNLVIEHQKQVANLPKEERTPVTINPEKGRFLFSLSPNDLVYVPTEEDLENPNSLDFGRLTKDQVGRIYKMVSCTGRECHFVPNSNASEIIKNENGTNSKNERIQDYYDDNVILDILGKPVMIKNICWKLEIDRIGNITKVIK